MINSNVFTIEYVVLIIDVYWEDYIAMERVTIPQFVYIVYS